MNIEFSNIHDGTNQELKEGDKSEQRLSKETPRGQANLNSRSYMDIASKNHQNDLI